MPCLLKRQRRTSTRRMLHPTSTVQSGFLLSGLGRRMILLVVFFLSCWTPVPSLALTGRSWMKRRTWFPPKSRYTSSSSSSRRMVLTTPESIIEQASTQNLLDLLIDESVRTSARGPIMMQFDPSSGWIWKRWRGTIFSETWTACVRSMLYAVIVLMIFKQFPSLKVHFSGFNVLWGQLLSVTTFTLTFFVNQSYALWRTCCQLSRRLQGRLHDVGMSLAIHAARKPPSSPNEPSTYTTASRQALELVSRYVRLFNLLTYASFTRSHRPILTPRGMRRLVERGLMTPQEREILVAAEVPATQRHNAVLLWITRVFVEGWQAGHFVGHTGFENQVLDKIHVARSCYGGIGDELAGRMPLAYAHIVQVLVDAVLWFYPFMAIASQMSDGLVVLGTGLLTISYQGLFDLAKQFLDPYDNESYGKGEDPLVVDTLIAETNAGSVRWMNSLNEFPVSPQRIRDGELSDYLLPARGYSVEELAEMEKERKQREREQQERKEREEEKRRIKEEKAVRLRAASEAIIPALFPNKPTSTFEEASSTICLEAVNGSTKTTALPGVAANSFTMSSTDAVAHVVSNMNAMVGGIPSDLIPSGTAAAKQEDQIVIDKRKRQKKEQEDKPATPDIEGEEAEGEEVVGEIQDFEDDDVFQVIEDWGQDETYVHKFRPSDSLKDLPWFDEIGPDGREYRLSQMLADEEWEEEKEAAREKEQPVQTFEEYSKRFEEIRDATDSELAETQEILSAVPNADSSSIRPDSKEEYIYDQTKLDGISQLWGCPPGELSDLPSYLEPPVSGETEFRRIAQLFGEPEAPPSRRDDYLDQDASDETASFGGIGSLWGGFGDELDDLDDTGGTRPVRESTQKSRDVREDADMPMGTFRVSQGSEVRLSQILADEVWTEEDEEDEDLEKAVSFEEYAQQIADIIEAEKEEQLETEAILNAPSFAEFVGTAEEDGKKAKAVKAANSTLEEDDLSVFEMDVVGKDDTSTKQTQWSGGNTTIWTEPGPVDTTKVEGGSGDDEEDAVGEESGEGNPNDDEYTVEEDESISSDAPTVGETSVNEGDLPKDETKLEGGE